MPVISHADTTVGPVVSAGGAAKGFKADVIVNATMIQ